MTAVQVYGGDGVEPFEHRYYNEIDHLRFALELVAKERFRSEALAHKLNYLEDLILAGDVVKVWNQVRAIRNEVKVLTRDPMLDCRVAMRVADNQWAMAAEEGDKDRYREVVLGEQRW